jgi:LysM repeat protein
MKNATIAILFLFILTARAIAQPVPTNDFPFKITVDEYIDKYWQIAVEEMYRSRIPASITLAQGIIESGNGNSRLALVGNNHFGIKCKKDWKGDTLRHDDDAPQECFRKYNSAHESYKDHSDFLKKGARYAFLFDLDIHDYKGWAHGLKKAGYATNPRYAEILIGVIERNNLHRFDHMKPGEKQMEQIAEQKKETIQQEQQKGFMINGVQAMVVAPGESYASIALANDMRVWQVYKYNDLAKDAQIKTGDTLYLKPKNYKGAVAEHIVFGNETMHIISQRYAIKLSRLLSLNRMQEGQEPEKGETIFLRSKRKTTPKLKQTNTTESEILVDNKVYDNAQKNIETTGPSLPKDPYDLEARGIKDPMAFIHEVQAGETLFGIAKRYNIQVDGLKDLNKLSSDIIKVGDRLVVNPNQPRLNKNEESIVPGYHIVVQGETLYSIAKLYGTTVDLIKAINELTSDTINIGDELVIIPRHGEKPGEQKVTDEADEAVYYIVREKETIYAISRKFGTTESELRKMNNLLDNTILVGQKLRVR